MLFFYFTKLQNNVIYRSFIGYNVSYSDDKHYGASTYHVQESVSQIQQEIMTNGPVEGAFTVYADFPTYKSGELR